MFEKTITFTDYNGEKREEKHCFHLNKAEIAKWLTTDGDYTFDKVLEKIVEKRNGKEVMSVFEDLIYRSYGEKSLDGRRFIKTEEVKRNFIETEAYSELFMELCTNSAAAAEFLIKILPKDLGDDVDKVFTNPENLPENLRKLIPVDQIKTGLISSPE